MTSYKTTNFTLIRGKHRTLRITVEDADGAVFVLTDYKARFTVKEAEEDTVAKICKATLGITGGADVQMKVVTPTSGIMEVYLLPGDTSALTPGNYLYEVEIQGGTGILTTVLKGTITLEAQLITWTDVPSP